MWNDLNIKDKAELIKLGVLNGVTNLNDIRTTYNIYKDSPVRAYKNGGYKPSASIKKRISDWEGTSMATNRPFDVEAEGFNRALPQGALNKLSQQQLDALFSYSYNVGSGNFKKRVSPVLQRYFNGKASVKDVQNSMWAAGDSKLRGLAKRRAIERAMFGNSQIIKPVNVTEVPEVPKITSKPSGIDLFPIGNAIIPNTDVITKNSFVPPNPVINNSMANVSLPELQPMDIISMIPVPKKLNIRI